MSKKIIIAADSSANLYSADFPGFVSVPLKIVTDEKEYTDDGKLDVSEMLADLSEYKGRSSTACPGVGDWLSAFGDADEIYGISLTSKLSGCYNSASVAAEEYLSEHPDRKAFVLDTLSTGPESELIVEKCRELTESGLGFETVKEKIIRYSRHTHLFFSLESLSNFAKNGRVSTALAVAASFFGIRIVGKASDKGELEPLHKCRGEKRAIGQLWECMLKSGYSGGKVRIRHSGNPNAADILSQQIKNSFPNADIKIGENRGLCSYYAEKGGILIGFES